MKHILSAALVAVSLLSYSQETKKSFPAKLNVKVARTEEDPICGMKTAQFLKDTLTYNKNYTGFGTHCKEVQKKNLKIH